MVLNFKLSVFREKLFKQFLIVVLGLSLLNCGFKLRGAYELPAAMKLTYIDQKQVDAELIRALKIALKSSNIKIVDAKTSDAATLRLYKASKEQRTVSVDSTGRAREYALSYALSFTLIASQLEISEQTIRIERDFIFDPEDVLGNSRETSQLYEEMQQDLVRLLLLRLQSKA